MPIKWESPPKSGIDKNPTAIDTAIRRGPVMAALGIALLIAPVVLVLAWMYIGNPISHALFGFDIIQWLLSNQYSFALIMMLLIILIIVHLCAVCILAERKISAYIQDRRGPDRVGWRGVLQPVADGLKFLLKEDVTPANVDKPVYILAPCISFIIALIAFAVLPWAGVIVWPWTAADGSAISVTTQVAPLSIGVLYILAVGSMSPYGVVLGGWASNNKYSFYGGMRATAQMLSYEVPLGLGVLVLLLLAGSLRLEVIQDMQTASGIWNIFLHPIAFFIVLVAAFAETNRAPFDLAECEQELVGGFHTEYSSMKFALFFLAEYAHMITGSALLVCLFLGGWEPLPFLSIFGEGSWLSGIIGHNTCLAALLKFGVFWGKVCAILTLYMVVRWTLPRFRFDQLMQMAWKWLVPVGMVMVLIAGVMAALNLRINPADGLFSGHNYLTLLAHLVANGLVLAVLLLILSRSKAPITGRQGNLPTMDVRPAST